jgi:DNA (cytosine-5)-methyltransferase 1
MISDFAHSPMPPYQVIEGFSGPGGMSLGLERAGFELLRAFDIDPFAVKTHCRNLGNRCEVLDAKNVTGKELLGDRLKGKELALFAGGPPCQGFSKARRGGHIGDERNGLVLEYLRIVSELKPRFFIFENVAIFGQLRGLKYVKEMNEKLGGLYSLHPHFYNSADYGLAQTRERFVIVGKRKDQKCTFHVPTPTTQPWLTVRDVIGNMPEPPKDFSVHPEYPNHQLAKITAKNIERFSHVPQGGGWQDIPMELRLPCHQRADTTSGGWPDVYGRLSWKGQCPTITGGFDNFTRGRYGHPKANRAITPREAARLQGFPDDFVFEGTRGDVRSQIGNAVPPPLACVIGKEIMRCLLVADGRLPRSAEDVTLDQLDLFEAVS